MLISFCFCFLAYFPWPNAAAIWTRSIKEDPGRGEPLREPIGPGDELAEGEFGDIFPDHALAQNVNKPDCFRTAIGQMQQRCADLDGLEEEKISFAISMTLCELEIAHLSPPMECRLIQNAAATPMKRRHCVEALARSAQSWSSYSGYFRESTRMCYAYQQLNDIDVAKDIYQNITAEKLRLVRFLLGREQSFQKNDQQLSVSLESMHEILGDLRGFSGVFNSVVADMTDLSRGIMKHVTASLDETLTLISRQQIEQQAHALLEVDTGISRILSKHAESLEGAVKTLGNELSYHSETLLQQVNLHDDELSRVMNQVNHQWNEMIGGISSLHLSISQASQATDRVGQQLQAHQEETAASYLVQLAATKNAEQLALALENLTSTTHVELQQISNATQRITESLSVPQGQATRIWYSILLGAFRIFGRGNLPAYHQVSEHAVFRILIMVGHLAWSTAWFLLSAMMSASLLPLRHLLFRPRKPSRTTAPTLSCEVENLSYAGRHETPASPLYTLSSSNGRTNPRPNYGKPQHRLRMSLIPERLVRMPADPA